MFVHKPLTGEERDAIEETKARDVARKPDSHNRNGECMARRSKILKREEQSETSQSNICCVSPCLRTPGGTAREDTGGPSHPPGPPLSPFLSFMHACNILSQGCMLTCTRGGPPPPRTPLHPPFLSFMHACNILSQGCMHAIFFHKGACSRAPGGALIHACKSRCTHRPMTEEERDALEESKEANAARMRASRSHEGD